jgi:hypothetical protein
MLHLNNSKLFLSNTCYRRVYLPRSLLWDVRLQLLIPINMLTVLYDIDVIFV